MDIIQKGVITLIKSAIDEKAYPLPEGFSVEEAYDFIMKHRVYMLAYDGAVRCGIDKKDPAMQKLFRLYINGMMRSEKQLAEVDKIFSAFDEKGIDNLPLKGCNMKYLYPKPELRLMGDADILIKEEEYEKIRDILSGIGFREEDGMDHHIAWHSENLYLEIHKKPFSIGNTEFSSYYGNGWERAVIKENRRWGYRPEDEFIYLLTHFAVHCRGGGIGIRHAADFYVYRRSHPDMDEKYMESELSEIGLLKLYKNIKGLLGYWFEGRAGDEGTVLLSDFILSGGDWGSSSNAFLALEISTKKKSGEEGFSKVKSIINIIFQPLSFMKIKYVRLQKYPFLLPFYWVKRWGEVLVFRRKRIGQKIDMLKNTDEQRLLDYEEKLRVMGIKYTEE